MVIRRYVYFFVFIDFNIWSVDGNQYNKCCNAFNYSRIRTVWGGLLKILALRRKPRQVYALIRTTPVSTWKFKLHG